MNTNTRWYKFILRHSHPVGLFYCQAHHIPQDQLFILQRFAGGQCHFRGSLSLRFEGTVRQENKGRHAGGDCGQHSNNSDCLFLTM